MINYKVAISFVLGALAGGALGAYLMKDKYEKESRLAIDSVKEYYSQKYGVDIPFKNDEDAKDGAEERVEESTDPRPAPGEALRTEYHFDDKEEYTETEMKAITQNNIEEEKPDIYVIDVDTYCDTNPHYGKESLLYYLKDHVLVDENMDEVLDEENLVGPGLRERFAQDFGKAYEDDPIYIRNDALSTDYEISPRNANFYGMTDEEGYTYNR